ncbi:hypothetical protein BDV26DRAFT_265609 [Aspergillus bertholletiae]|uniref:Uncharacterized protein n=1 Tax=Aspergillus bertholletiae TaxID=1226010 RepID=A0A5N7B5L0_9EURO|nr:hypothetical protein BDV26DRAFT_265609 [Aspergillus bertholletiae]
MLFALAHYPLLWEYIFPSVYFTTDLLFFPLFILLTIHPSLSIVRSVLNHHLLSRALPGHRQLCHLLS